jgi:hypothetical protein
LRFPRLFIVGVRYPWRADGQQKHGHQNDREEKRATGGPT